ncbi:kunitz-type serine protease inhibitor 2-like [Drosophila hydei]|uniref:Kunitz-type serine protease inhibitor 2-like n=1 Tax=Drosophila hydei TaxID=7224 RepID=A0A6J1LWM1_DROHY|nr:kunitz-type serine protease inhibitor 2-like [Drosophila hydei]
MSCFWLLLLLTALAVADWPNRDEGSDACSQLPEYGTCRSHIRMWYFNRYSRRCQPFDYSACGGNLNRFFSRNECIQHCSLTRRPNPNLLE